MGGYLGRSKMAPKNQISYVNGPKAQKFKGKSRFLSNFGRISVKV